MVKCPTCDDTGMTRYLGRDNSEEVEDCPDCAPREIVCERCNGSGLIGCHTSYPCSYIAPGPVPEHARNAYEAKCDECDGSGKRPQPGKEG